MAESSRDLLLRNLLLEKLVKGYMETDECIGSMLEVAGIRFPSDYFALLLVAECKPLPSDPTIPSHADFSAFETGFSSLGLCLPWKAENYSVFILGLYPKVVDAYQQCSERAQKEIFLRSMEIFVKYQRTGFKLSVYLSGFSTGISNLSMSYQKIHDMYVYRLQQQHPDLCGVFCCDAPGDKRLDQAFLQRRSEAARSRFFRSIAKRDFPSAGKQMEEILFSYIHQNIDGYRLYNSIITYNLQMALSEISPPLSSLEQREIMFGVHAILYEDRFRSTNNYESYSEISAKITRIFQWIAQEVSADEYEPLNQIESCIEFIQHHYMDIDLNVSKLCHKLGYTHLSTFSKAFKRFTGLNPLDYLHFCRINAVKKLLRETNLPLHEIAMQCGYSSGSQMIQVFKRYENVSPGAYRKEVKPHKNA